MAKVTMHCLRCHSDSIYRHGVKEVIVNMILKWRGRS
ncbi:hypothetical protein DRY71_21835 [Salmonella enterica subsp. enterica serovar Newport]|uniref:InsA N-terminal zinc ribbon domain-containing protein n=1 Tax=Salmonella newport TaxID=108619 RepID=A0A5U9KVQ9_SALNE|nr:hypothetical protein [Salmonella enterica subsp. enterica serovar Newport]